MTSRLNLVAISSFIVLILGLGVDPPLSQARGTTRPQTATQPDPKALLQAAAEACLKVKTIEYVYERESAGNSGYQITPVTATIKQARAEVPQGGFLPGTFVARGTVGGADNKANDFAFSYDGKTFRMLDHAEHAVLVVKSPTDRAIGGLLGPTEFGLIGFTVFSHPAPFKDIIEQSDNLTYEGQVKINDTPCHTIAVTRTIDHPQAGKLTMSSRWLIGVEDHLPRRLVSGPVQGTVRILSVNKPASEDAFFINAPNGYGEKLITGLEPKTAGLLATGSAAPDWTLRDSAGGEHSLASYRGKVIVLDFWGTWCVPCIKAMHGIQALHEKFKEQNVVFFGIAVGDDEGDPAGFMKRKGYTYGLLLKGDAVAKNYNAQLLPTLYVVGADGQIVHAEKGYREESKTELAAIIEQQLKGGGKK
jgi:peroxiredoxin